MSICRLLSCRKLLTVTPTCRCANLLLATRNLCLFAGLLFVTYEMCMRGLQGEPLFGGS
jgi:hypothetical protein|eukprot:COSAG02_NODE_735_length_17872_cov_20.966860_7_plen_59_part_00